MSLEQAFSSVQKEYLAGFFSGVNQRGGYNPFTGRLPDGTYTADAGSGVANLAAEEETVYGTTIEDLCKEERIKHELNGLDCYERIREAVVANELPEGVLRFVQCIAGPEILDASLSDSRRNLERLPDGGACRDGGGMGGGLQ